MDKRQQNLKTWLEKELNSAVSLKPVVGDASFRRYFRFKHHNQSFIAMDSPPEIEDPKPFVAIARAFAKHDLHVPQIYAADLNTGYLMISDLGDKLFHHELNSDNVDTLYQHAIHEIPKIQHCTSFGDYNLPPFNEKSMMMELTQFTQWFLIRYLSLTLNTTQRKILDATYKTLLAHASKQPQVTIHRDYHSRNLMVLPNHQVGILDFQDAAIGPITYDLVSLTRDCYIDWPVQDVENWALNLHQQLLDDKRTQADPETFLYWFDLMGMQRHLKAIFIFARKQLRDDNDFYLNFIPRTLNYIGYIAKKYPALHDFHHYLHEEILPAYEKIKK